MRLFVLFICMFFFSCGIPEFEASLEKPEATKDAEEEIFDVTFEFTSKDVSKSFLLYVRYDLNTSGSFTEDDFETSKVDSRKYLEDTKGYILTNFVDVGDESFDPEFSGFEPSLHIKFYQDISDQDQSVKISLNDETTEYFITMTNIIDELEVTHKIGDRGDSNYLETIKSFIGEDKENYDTINIEFAIIAKSVNITSGLPDEILSDPVYIGSFTLKI